jgi:hypothetical protein
MTLAGIAAADPNAPGGSFIDDNGNVHEAFIEAIAAADISRGCNPPANDRFCPNQPVTRQEMASFLTRALGLPPATTDYFTDDAGSVHQANINSLAMAGITRGCNPPTTDNFCPEDTVTREQMAAFLVRAFGYADTDPGDRFLDDDGSVFEDSIEAIAAAGVTKGCNPPDNTLFCPGDPVLRRQMASFLGRALSLTPITPPTVGTANLASIYFMYDQPTAGPYVAPIARYLGAAATPEDAVDLLLAGPTTAEISQVPSFSTEVPATTTRNGSIDVVGGVATVDLSGVFGDGGGSATMLSRLGQLTFSLAAFPAIDTVMLELDGVPVTSFSSEGIDISGGMDRDYFLGTGVVPEILVDSPASWQFVESPIEVTGIARAFEATVDWALYDNDGLELASGFTTASISGPDWGDMAFTIPYTVTDLQVGTLEVWETSAMDGSRTDLRETVVWLTP